MPIRCPTCRSSNIILERHLELPPSATWDENTLQAIHCRLCGFSAIGLYQESRRGALDSEAYHHTAFEISAPDYEIFHSLLDGCPDLSNWRCSCPVHARLDAFSEQPINTLAELNMAHRGTFPLQVG